MSASSFLMPIFIAGMIFVLAHLSKDRDFPKEMKMTAIAVAVLLIVIYVIFRLF